jgi:hypothetical protein
MAGGGGAAFIGRAHAARIGSSTQGVAFSFLISRPDALQAAHVCAASMPDDHAGANVDNLCEYRVPRRRISRRARQAENDGISRECAACAGSTVICLTRPMTISVA